MYFYFSLYRESQILRFNFVFKILSTSLTYFQNEFNTIKQIVVSNIYRVYFVMLLFNIQFSQISHISLKHLFKHINSTNNKHFFLKQKQTKYHPFPHGGIIGC